MKIEWTIDSASTLTGDVDPDDLLGTICLEHCGHVISDELAYLDSWFDCLTLASLRLNAEKEFSCDLVSEPDPILFRADGKVTSISYRKQIIKDVVLSDFQDAVRDAGMRLLIVVKKQTNGAVPESLVRLARLTGEVT